MTNLPRLRPKSGETSPAKPPASRPRYEKPVLVSLGALASGDGANCSFGSGDISGPCTVGAIASGQCFAGNTVI